MKNYILVFLIIFITSSCKEKELPIELNFVSTYVISENESITIDFDLAKSFNVEIELQFTLNEELTTVIPNDYELYGEGFDPVLNTLTFYPGEKVKSIIFKAVDDLKSEDLEQLVFDITVNNSKVKLLEEQIMIELENKNLNLTVNPTFEGFEGSFVSVGFTLDRVTEHEVIVYVVADNETSTANSNDYIIGGDDYNSGSKSITFLPDETSKSIDISFLRDFIHEENEIINLSLITNTGDLAIQNEPDITIINENFDDNLVLELLFDGSYSDSGPNAIQTIGNGVSLVNDRHGLASSAYYFDGLDDYILVENHSTYNFDANQNFTVSVWVNPSLIQSDLASDNNDILSKWNIDAEGFPFGLRIWNSTSTEDQKNRFIFKRYDGSNCNYNYTYTNANEFNEQWFHLAMKKEAEIISMCINGVLVQSTTDLANCTTSNIDDLSIGRRHTGLRFFTGVVDDLLIYSRALSDSEIATLSEN